MYARVVDGSVTEVGLPEAGLLSTGESVSNYNLLDEAILLDEGWLPVVDPGIPAHDEDIYYYVENGYNILPDHVEPVYELNERAPYLNATEFSIPSDGVTSSTVTYYDAHAPASVTFNVNGVESIVNTANSRASIDVVSQTPNDVIEVRAQGLLVSIEVV